MLRNSNLDFSEAVDYHYDKFPPRTLDAVRLLGPLASASSALARYDQMLKGMHNSEVLLAPLQSQEAVVSSRMEGTVSTLDEVLRYEAEHDESDGENAGSYRSETLEVALYARALRMAQNSIKSDYPLSSWLMKTAHKNLLRFGRGASLSPGEFKKDQNYLVDRIKKKVLFIPMRPEHLTDGMEALFSFINTEDDGIIYQTLIKTAITHLEFEALHPFKDGNGRIGRMLITLMLWKLGAISAPHFYVSSYFEQNRDDYIDKMRDVSRSDAWTEWVIFFLNALEAQANENLKIAETIRTLYDELKIEFREILASQWCVQALDFLFSKPVFRNTVFVNKSEIPHTTARRFTRILVERGILKELHPASGRRSALYSFEPLLSIVRG